MTFSSHSFSPVWQKFVKPGEKKKKKEAGDQNLKEGNAPPSLKCTPVFTGLHVRGV